jgi:methylmalonyl-CoA epimerase
LIAVLPGETQQRAWLVYTFSVPPLAIDHLGIAVRDLEAACRVYEALGFSIAAREEVPQEQVRVALLPVGESRIELLEPTGPTSTVARFLEKRGEGLHHYALRVPHLEAVVARLKQAGIRLVKDEIQTGAGGHRYVFLHPSSTGGVLIELVES